MPVADVAESVSESWFLCPVLSNIFEVRPVSRSKSQTNARRVLCCYALRMESRAG